MTQKHTMPDFLQGIITPAAYGRWLMRKAATHVKRDRKRKRTCSGSAYREAIHAAVLVSKGMDAYTGEKLDWHLISTYKNEDSKERRHAYKDGFALLPTVDHERAEATEASFKICSWRSNDAKNDMSHKVFVELCERVLRHSGFRVEKPGQPADAVDG